MRICSILLLALFVLAAPEGLFSQDFRSPLIISPYEITAGEVLVGKSSAPQAVTLVNTGPDIVHITGITIEGSFSQTNDCPSPPKGLAHNETCMIQITFRATAVGPSSGTLTVSDDVPGGPLGARLKGLGTLGEPAVMISPSNLNFTEQRAGIMSQPQTAMLINSGQRVLFISNLNVKGDFIIMPSSTCEKLSGPLAANASCTIVVTFTPLGAGKREGQVTISDDAPDSPQNISLQGLGKQ